MGRKYTRTETIAQIEEAAKDMSTFYTATCIRRTGTTYKADGGIKVELLRFPFENIETVSPSTSYANGVTGCDTPCTPGAIVIIPTVKSPNAAPLDLEEVPDCDTGTPSKWEIEILDY